jgi:hypothetical protein
MSVVSVQQALSGALVAGSEVTVRGWVRTRRDSKAGLSFVNRQRRLLFRSDPDRRAVHPAQLRERSEATLGRLRGDRHRHAGASQGQGQSVRMQALEHRSRRLGRRSGNLSDPAQGALAGIPARSGAPASAHQSVRRGHPHPPLPGAGGAPLLPREGLLLDQHADHLHLRRRRRRTDVPHLHAGHGEPAAHARRQGRLQPRLLRQGGLPDRLRPAQRGGLSAWR